MNFTRNQKARYCSTLNEVKKLDAIVFMGEFCNLLASGVLLWWHVGRVYPTWRTRFAEDAWSTRLRLDLDETLHGVWKNWWLTQLLATTVTISQFRKVWVPFGHNEAAGMEMSFLSQAYDKSGRTTLKLCTAKFCLQNQNNLCRGQVLPKVNLLWQNIQRAHKTGPNCDPKTRFAIWSTRQCEATKPFEKLGRTTFASPNSICFSSPKNGHEKIEQFNDIILCILPCLAESSGVHNAGTLSTLSPLWIKFQQVCRLRPTPARLRNLGHPNCHKTVVKPTFYIPSLLAECTGVIKSKRFPQCEQSIHPVLNIYYYCLTGWYWTPGEHEQSDPKSCCVRSLGGQRGAVQKQRTQ